MRIISIFRPAARIYNIKTNHRNILKQQNNKRKKQNTDTRKKAITTRGGCDKDIKKKINRHGFSNTK